MPRTLLAVLTAACALAPAAAAQGLATDAAPFYGTLAPAGEAASLDLVARGTDEVPDALLVDGCVGYVDRAAPDVAVDWAGGDLRVWVRAEFDPTLLVHGPDGWACDDDTVGSLPVVELEDAPAGRYAVWLGTFSDDATGAAATLYAGPPPPAPVLDAAAAPAAGRIAAAGGFEAAQGAIEVAVSAGGPDAGRALDLGGAPTYCTGYLDASAPTAVVDYDAEGGTGTLTLGAQSAEDDLVLAVVGPDGGVTCNDDFYGTDPLVEVEGPASGPYAVWVGTYRAGLDVGATLVVSETAPETFDDYEGGFGAPYSEGTYTPLDLDAVPGPRAAASDDGGSDVTVTVAPTGGNPVQGMSCTGSLEPAASVGVTLAGEGPFALRATGEDDLILTVRTPSGGWFCSDDADGLDPGIQIDTAEDGLYLVWIGTFSDDGTAAEATLSVAPGTVEYEESFDDYGRTTQSDGVYDGDALSAGPAAVTLDMGGATEQTEAVGAGGTVLNPVEGEVCAGFLPDAPTAAVVVPTGGDLAVSATSDDDDLTLVLRAPDGAWTCSDDADGTDPAIEVSGDGGTYEVWVGTFSRRDEPVPATLRVVR